MILLLGLLVPAQAIVPVHGARERDWNPRSFWYEPWGASGVHKGIDIFAPTGTPAVAAVPGVVVFRGTLGIGGNVVVILGPKWRLHYYAHLQQHEGSRFVAPGAVVGRVGTSGNAAGKPAHLHYAVISLLPMPWRCTRQTQGWKKAFYLDPAQTLPASVR